METKIIIPILWEIPMYGYYWRYTIAQIELMANDTPIISYGNKKGKKRADKPRISKEEADRKALEWEKRYGNGETEVTLGLSDYNLS